MNATRLSIRTIALAAAALTTMAMLAATDRYAQTAVAPVVQAPAVVQLERVVVTAPRDKTAAHDAQGNRIF